MLPEFTEDILDAVEDGATSWETAKMKAGVPDRRNALIRICPGCGTKITGTCWECVGDGGLR